MAQPNTDAPLTLAVLEELKRRPDVTFVELEPAPAERVTFGYTDSQIRGLTPDAIEAQIRQSDRLAESLRQQLMDTESRTSGLRAVLQRKYELEAL